MVGNNVVGRTLLAVVMLWTGVATAQEMPNEYKAVLTTLGKAGDFKEGVLKVNLPRNDVRVAIGERRRGSPVGTSARGVGPRQNGGTGVEISERRVANVVVLSISGDITIGGGGTMLLADKLRSVLQQGYECLVLDVANVSRVDSWGLGELAQWNAAVHNRGVSLKLLHVAGRFAELLALTRLDLVFECIGHESDVLATLTESPRASPNEGAP